MAKEEFKKGFDPNEESINELTKYSPAIVSKDQALKILNHFPPGKRNFRLLNIFKGSRDGWTKQIFIDKAFNKGPTLILLKTTKNAICGGFTTVNWENSNVYKRDTEAFVFNVDTKFTPNNYDKAIYTEPKGFTFGNGILRLTGDKLNENAEYALCLTGKYNHYDIEGDVSPLTGEKNKFQCAELEVYRVIY